MRVDDDDWVAYQGRAYKVEDVCGGIARIGGEISVPVSDLVVIASPPMKKQPLVDGLKCVGSIPTSDVPLLISAMSDERLSQTLIFAVDVENWKRTNVYQYGWDIGVAFYKGWRAAVMSATG